MRRHPWVCSSTQTVGGSYKLYAPTCCYLFFRIASLIDSLTWLLSFPVPRVFSPISNSLDGTFGRLLHIALYLCVSAFYQVSPALVWTCNWLVAIDNDTESPDICAILIPQGEHIILTHPMHFQAESRNRLLLHVAHRDLRLCIHCVRRHCCFSVGRGFQTVFQYPPYSLSPD